MADIDFQEHPSQIDFQESPAPSGSGNSWWQDFLHPDAKDQPTDTTGAMLKSFSVPSNIVASAILEGAKRVGTLGKEGLGADTWRQAATGETNAPQILKDRFGAGPIAANAIGLPLQVASDPYLGFLSGAKPGEAAPAAENAVSDWIKNRAENLAVKATGATGRQAAEFPQNAGRDLLDQGIVKFGSSPGDIADNIGNMVEGANTTDIDTSLLSPVQKAAESRASQLRQAPIGGLTDMASLVPAGGALMSGNPALAAKLAVLPIARRVIGPRTASAGAVTLDALSNVARTTPQALGQYAPAITAAASKGDQSLAVTNYILGTSDPGYRQLADRISFDSNEK